MIQQELISCIADETGLEPQAIHAHATLLSLGLDSLEASSLILELEDRFAIDLGGCDLTTSISDLFALCGAR